MTTTKEENASLLGTSVGTSTGTGTSTGRSKSKSSKSKKKDQRRAPIENVEFATSTSVDDNNNDKEGWGKSAVQILSSRSLLTTGSATSAKSHNTNMSYSSNSRSHSAGPPSALAHAAASAAAMEQQYQQQQQQQAYYTQQFYMQQQQQRYPGYAPWPAPQQFYPGHQVPVPMPGYSVPMHPQVQHPSTLYRRATTGTTATKTTNTSTTNSSNNIIQATTSHMSNGSEDDEYVALLQQNFAKVGAGVAGGYGSIINVSTSNAMGNSPTNNSHKKPEAPPPPPPPNINCSNMPQGLVARPKHRRAQSDGNGFTFHNNKSNGPASKEKPPMGNSPRTPVTARKGLLKPKHGRSQSLTGLALTGGTAPPPPTRGHRRCNSNASSVGVASVASEASFMSITSDIRKSAFYGGVDEPTGKTQLHYPNEHIYVCTSDDHPELITGKVYKVAIDTEAFEEYHRQAEDRMWEDDLDEMECQQHDNGNTCNKTCGCKCHICVNCPGHNENNRRNNNNGGGRDPFSALPPNQFALAVDSTVYKRVLDEISQAEEMPCGLFFCGHHEDVAHPSINIALVLVTALFLTLGYVAWMGDA